MGNTQGNDIYIAEPHLSDLFDSRSLIGVWRDDRHGSYMRLDYAYDGKSKSIVGISSTGLYAQVYLTGAIVDLKLILPDGYSPYHYKGLLEITDDDKQTHTIRWTKRDIKNGKWYLASSWIKI